MDSFTQGKHEGRVKNNLLRTKTINKFRVWGQGGSKADEESALGWRNIFKTELAGIAIGCFLKPFGRITPGVYITTLTDML